MTTRGRPSRVVLALLVVGSVLLAGCGPDDDRHTSAARLPDGPVTVPAPRAGPFTAASVWKKNIAKAPLAAGSKAMARNLNGQVTDRYGGVAAFNVTQYNASFYGVSKDQPRTTIAWDDCQGKGSVPQGLYGPGGQFVGVPIPSSAVPSAGTDRSLVIYQKSTDTMWDFWRIANRADGWHACWGGRIDKVSTSKGFFTGSFGASASGLSLIGGAVGIKEAQAGRIDHALALAIPNPAVHTRVSWPAQRSDGFDTSPAAIPEGTRLRLDPRVKVSTLKLHPIAKMIARAAQKYGFIVTDKSGAVAVVTESGAGVQARTGTNPWNALMQGTPDYLIMKNFPWDKLQALPKNYGKPKR
ncbi:DUF4124 domain-containing protein [Spongisporangium articulatum]|uniref:DUF4124 domain-containing protein n=1 Tax=Spongisporangium articulatum TaxID=3362603 RepID=A0ABW8AT72_9ACTN